MILQGPKTRTSLIASLSQPASREAWVEFSTIYRPLIVRVATAKGLQHADAEDLAQDVLAIVGRKIGDFELERPGSFRGWLGTITRNLVVNHLSRNKGPIGSGDSAVLMMLQQIPQSADPTATLFDLELRRFQFQTAAAEVKTHFSEATWDAFWMTAVERKSIGDAAKLLNKTEGAIRMARCRVLTRLRETAQRDRTEKDENDDR